MILEVSIPYLLGLLSPMLHKKKMAKGWKTLMGVEAIPH
jgi:hypothetical protein